MSRQTDAVFSPHICRADTPAAVGARHAAMGSFRFTGDISDIPAQITLNYFCQQWQSAIIGTWSPGKIKRKR